MGLSEHTFSVKNEKKIFVSFLSFFQIYKNSRQKSFGIWNISLVNVSRKKVPNNAKMSPQRNSLCFENCERRQSLETRSQAWRFPGIPTAFRFKFSTQKADVLHSDWLVQVPWLFLTNQSALFQHSIDVIL